MSIRITFQNICRKANVVLIIKKAMQDLLQDNKANLGYYFFLCVFAVLFWVRRRPGIVWGRRGGGQGGPVPPHCTGGGGGAARTTWLAEI